jgi:hypothetical protein
MTQGHRPPFPGVDPARVRLLLTGSVENLVATWDQQRALFPYSSRLRGSELVNDYAHPIAVRYTINSLLGLLRNARSRAPELSEADVRGMADAYFQRPPDRETLAADHGLTTVLLAELDADPGVLGARATTLAHLLSQRRSELNMQDLAWILWGGAAAARAGAAGALDVVRRALDIIVSDFLDAGTGLPRHTTPRYRRNVVSFGSLTYFLRAMHEAAAALGDERAGRLFESGVARTIALQGPLGEWPWMISCKTGKAFDFYPVFAVHQDSMAMLFLHAAAADGLPGAADAVGRSLAWDFGENELRRQMFVEQPFFASRAIARAARAPRLRRYLRSSGLGGSAATGATKIRINDECRSYHLGWVLYAWSDWEPAPAS